MISVVHISVRLGVKEGTSGLSSFVVFVFSAIGFSVFFVLLLMVGLWIWGFSLLVDSFG